MTETKEIIRPYFDIFEDVVEDNSADWLQYRDYRDVNANYADENYEFRIVMDKLQEFFLPHKSYLEIKGKILKADGTNFTVNDNIALQNNAAGIMSRYEFRMNEQVADYIDYAETTNTAQNIIYNSKEYNSSIASQQLFYADTADNRNLDSNNNAPNHLFQYSADAGATWNNITQANTLAKEDVDGDVVLQLVGGVADTDLIRVNPHTVANTYDSLETVNQGHRKRWQLTNGSRSFVVHIPLKNIFGLLKSWQEVTRGITLTLRMQRNDNRYLFLGDPATAGVTTAKLQIEQLIWWVPYVMPNSKTLPMLESKLSSQLSHTIPFLDVQTYRSNKQTGQANNRLYQLRSKRSRPVRVFVFFQTAARYEGNNGQCKRVFDNIGITNMYLNLNSSIQYPEREYKTLFGDGTAGSADDYARVYSEFLRCSLKDHDLDQSGIVDYQNFKTLYPIFCFDLTERFTNSMDPEKSLIEIFYSNDRAVDHYMWIMVESEVKLKLSCNKGQMKYENVVY